MAVSLGNHLIEGSEYHRFQYLWISEAALSQPWLQMEHKLFLDYFGHFLLQ